MIMASVTIQKSWFSLIVSVCIVNVLYNIVQQVATFHSCATIKYANVGLLSDTCKRKGKKEQTIELNDLDGNHCCHPHCKSYCYLKLKCCFSCKYIHSRYSLSLKFFHTLILSLPLWTYDIDPFYCWLLLSSSPPPPRRIVFALTAGCSYDHHSPFISIVALLSSPVLYL